MGVPEPWVMGMDRIRWILPFLAMRLNGKRKAEKISSLIRAFPMSFFDFEGQFVDGLLSFCLVEEGGG